ncbi:MAG: glycosyltransferase [Paludibacter sp.]|nr:glycosyltransferase [Paludibacter sp.]
MIKVLFLSAWYPNRYDAMAGLFVRKHAEAVSRYCQVQVLYVHGDKNISEIEVVKDRFNQVDEYIVYFPEKQKGILRRVYKIFSYIKAVQKGFRIIKKTSGLPDIVHVNILTRSGILAYFLKNSNDIPYVITEHWTRYLPSRNSFNGFFRKYITKVIVKNASAVMPVSEDLKKSMLTHKLFNKNYYVINNVVEDIFFQQTRINISSKKTILHISCFDDNQKNISGLLRSIKELSTKRNDFKTVVVGTGIDYNMIKRYADELNISKEILHFTGELPPEKVAKEFAKCDFFVMFSNHENSPVVICESLCCGKPVISTNVGGISELLNESNGILIPAGDEKILVEKIDFMLNHFQDFDGQAIQNEAGMKFSYERIGNDIESIYKKILNEIQPNY